MAGILSIKIKKIIKIATIVVASAATLLFVAWLGINIYVNAAVSEYILTPDEAKKLDVDAVIVLGAKVSDSGRPGLMLSSRLDMGIELYNGNASEKLIFSGDHGRTEYNEVGGMYLYALDKGVPESDIFLDHAGFSTYETACRAKKIFLVESAVMVSQEYHVPRAVYCARRKGIQAYGVSSDSIRWKGLPYFKFREGIAVCKDFLWCLFDMPPTYLGEEIPVWSDTAVTHDIENNNYIENNLYE